MPISLYEAFCNEIDERYSILSDAARADLKRMLKRVEEDAFDRGYYPKKRKAGEQHAHNDT